MASSFLYPTESQHLHRLLCIHLHTRSHWMTTIAALLLRRLVRSSTLAQPEHSQLLCLPATPMQLQWTTMGSLGARWNKSTFLHTTTVMPLRSALCIQDLLQPYTLLPAWNYMNSTDGSSLSTSPWVLHVPKYPVGNLDSRMSAFSRFTTLTSQPLMMLNLHWPLYHQQAEALAHYSCLRRS